MQHLCRFGRFVVCALVALSLGACVPMHDPSVSPQTRRAADLVSKTVALVDEGQEGAAEPHAYCSGVWVGDNAILTADHCVEDLPIGSIVEYVVRGDVDSIDHDTLDVVRVGRVYAEDPDHDLALIIAPLAPAHTDVVLADRVTVGEPDYTMGHSIGQMLWSYSEGSVSAVRLMDLGVDQWWVQSTAPISPGNSGGGLFDSHGDLLGICSRAFSGRAENLNFYVHVNYVRAFLSGVMHEHS